MKIKQILELLSSYDPELECDINIEQDYQPDACELREVLIRNSDRETRTILQIKQRDYRNYQQLLGWPVSTSEKRELEMEKILDWLANPTEYTPRFTNVHGDWRFYYPGGNQATCYGTAYNPQLFIELERRGWIESRPEAHCSVPRYAATKTGRERLLVISA